ncbi:MAG TPA: 16S rRNA (cytosine(967)-C(5))-methyltransferase RsmB [Solirubrobacteraceae bacterium]
MSPARACAFAAVRRVFEQGAYADRAFAAEARRLGLDPRDRALAMRIAYGTVQRRRALDHVAGRLVRRPLAELEPAVLAALRIGLFQLLYLDAVGAHAAVNESVELVKQASPGGAGLINAVLRRAVGEGPEIVGALDDRDPAAASIMHSVPEWLAELWWRELGTGEARALLRRINEPPESAIRANTLLAPADQVAGVIGVPNHPAPGLPEGLVLDGPFDAEGSALWRDGAIMPQSRGSMAAARELAPQPGERVLDLCAAPGAKTTHLAALLEDDGVVVAVERNSGRARGLEQTAARMHASCVRVELGDAAAPRADPPFDRVLVDPPCSGLGTLQSRPDLRWRASPEAIAELSELQQRIVAAGASALAPGGVLVYSVCTISSAESERVIDRLLVDRQELELERATQLLPHRDGTDGFFIARLRRPAR